MASQRLPLLRGRISRSELYQSPQPGKSALRIPSPDPQSHRLHLMRELDAIELQVEARPPTARDENATREIIAVRPAVGAALDADQLDSRRADARLIGIVPETGTVLIDAASPNLDFLRKKLDAFADDSNVTVKIEKDGSQTLHRSNERAIAPVGSIGLALLDDVRGANLRASTLIPDRAYWLEIACRGGYRRPPSETINSRAQIARRLHHMGVNQQLDEFITAEHVYFFVRITETQLDQLLKATDCIYEAELAPSPLRDLKLLDEVTSKDIKGFSLRPPEAHAPAVVLLDTGIATGHPLLKTAILTATTAGETIPSPEDTHGHGTQMAGLALYRDLGAALEHGEAQAPHWLQSSRILVAPVIGASADENYQKWPILTQDAVRTAEQADPGSRDRVFALAVTRSMQNPPLEGLLPTLWSHAVDQIAHCEGKGRLLIVSAGNARYEQWKTLAENYPKLQLSEKIHQPAQAANALTVGAYTMRIELPQAQLYAEAHVVAKRPGGISPFTSTGLPGKEWPIKPDIVMEGGNLAIAGPLTDAGIPTLSALTTGHRHMLDRPLTQSSMTSEATARAAHLAARIWAVEPRLRPETVRGLIVHSASWTPEMLKQFDGLNERLLACGYGVPDEQRARDCAADRATVIIEDDMPNAIVQQEPKKIPPKRETTSTTERKYRRKVKFYRLPIPSALLDDTDSDVELRVTLSYFPEPNRFGRSVFHGLDLKWDMQGPHESEAEFHQRINALMRPEGPQGKRLKTTNKTSFPWEIGMQLRSRGTVQSDRWRGRMSTLSGDKLIAIVPVLGWWDQRKALRTQEMRFSLVISVFGPGVYAAIKPQVELPIETDVEVPISIA